MDLLILEFISRATPMFVALVFVGVVARRAKVDCMRLEDEIKRLEVYVRKAEDTDSLPEPVRPALEPEPEPELEPQAPLPCARLVSR